MGVNAENSQGRTIMGWERIGRFVSKYSNQFPALDYFSSSNKAPKRDAKTGEIYDQKTDGTSNHRQNKIDSFQESIDLCKPGREEKDPGSYSRQNV